MKIANGNSQLASASNKAVKSSLVNNFPYCKACPQHTCLLSAHMQQIQCSSDGSHETA